ncbi:MAG TPA: lipid-A-disaccharide synthase [Ignavibacteriaceae bacterium]|nr:lipid-A-disaccharide synthase [Ignavibacteriaceae bacterium]
MANKNLMIIAGEMSGDLHGGSLITELLKIDPQINVFGIGGDKMKAAGMQLNYHLHKMAFLGFLEVVKHIPFIRKVQKRLISVVKEKEIATVVLIDYPGFNLSIAKKMKRLNVKIIYYISPQIWAWGGGRIEKIKKIVNKMLVVFPFEEKLYSDHNVDVDFVGHPLLERLNDYNFLEKDELFDKFELEKDKEILLILPGSRDHEVRSIFPETIKAAEKLAKEFNLQIVTACSSNIDENIFYKITEIRNFKVIKENTYNLLKYSKFGIVKSGTSTLEAGLFCLPMIIVYKTSSLTYLIGKSLIKVDNIGMANIISGEKVVPELIQKDVSEKSIYSEAKKILSDKTVFDEMKKKLGNIKKKLGSEGASERAAKSIYKVMNEN